jgi:hypothetical protein
LAIGLLIVGEREFRLAAHRGHCRTERQTTTIPAYFDGSDDRRRSAPDPSILPQADGMAFAV